MGGEQSKIVADTDLSNEEVTMLREKFDYLARDNVCDYMNKDYSSVDRKTFVAKFPIPQRDLASRIFNVLDRSGGDRPSSSSSSSSSGGGGVLTFANFCQTVVTLQRGSVEEKIPLAFKLYDASGKGSFNRTDVESLIQDLLGCSAPLLASIGFADPEDSRSMTHGGKLPSRTMRERAAVDCLMAAFLENNSKEALMMPRSASKYATTGRSGSQGKEASIDAEKFALFARRHPEVLGQLDGAFLALQKASGWSWRREPTVARKRPSWCAIS